MTGDRRQRPDPAAARKASPRLAIAAALLVPAGLPLLADDELPGRVLPAPSELPSYTIERVSSGITIDGRADERDWQAAAPIELIVPWLHDAAEPVQETEARMLWSPADLFIVYKCADPYIGAEIVDHDGATYLEDTVEIFATPNPDHVYSYYGYEMNVLGTLLDYVTFWRDGQRLTGGAGWQSEGVRIEATIDGTLNDHSDEDSGWVLEIAIPFDNFPPSRGPHPAAGRRPVAPQPEPLRRQDGGAIRHVVGLRDPEAPVPRPRAVRCRRVFRARRRGRLALTTGKSLDFRVR